MHNEVVLGFVSLRAEAGGPSFVADRRARVAAMTLLEEDRRRVGRELHDETGQVLTAALFQLDLCLADLTPQDQRVAERLRGLRETLLTASRDLRHLAHSLCPPMLDELGLLPTLTWLVRQFQEQHQIAVSLRAPDTAALPRAVAVALFRIVQESLTNVAKHARARSVRVELRIRADTVTCRIVDDGQGFDVGAQPMTSLGLIGMRERARQIGGDVTITSWPGRGTSVQVVVPLVEDANG
jgi:signal transduction histidine kinase